MRWAPVFVIAIAASAAACSNPFDSHPPNFNYDGGIAPVIDGEVIPDASCGTPPPPSAGNCECTSTIGWACTTCTFGEGTGPIACNAPGTGCQIENWEHGCQCTCNSAGWWDCMGETIGSTCPTAPPPDAGVPPTGCGIIEAESATSSPGWAVSPVPWTHGGAELSANVAGASFVLPFDGTSVTLYYEQGPSRGEIAVTIDGFAPVIVDATASGSDTWGNATTVATGLAPGPHTATITCETLDCDVDYIDVTCAAQ